MLRIMLAEGKRLDGRTPTGVRPIWCEVDDLPGPHGSAVFTRGETQSLTRVVAQRHVNHQKADEKKKEQPAAKQNRDVVMIGQHIAQLRKVEISKHRVVCCIYYTTASARDKKVCPAPDSRSD